jgi:hypothetical protein
MAYVQRKIMSMGGATPPRPPRLRPWFPLLILLGCFKGKKIFLQHLSSEKLSSGEYDKNIILFLTLVCHRLIYISPIMICSKCTTTVEIFFYHNADYIAGHPISIEGVKL